MSHPDASSSRARAIELFYAYSHKDEGLRDKLQTHLSALKKTGMISDWHDRRISAGTGWTGEIDEHLNRAEIILLLVSADFIASDYCYDKEMARAMELHDQGKARVIPVILRPCDWEGSPFGKLQGLPKDMKPVTSWASRDDAWKGVSIGIRKVVEELRATPRRGTEIDVEAGRSGKRLQVGPGRRAVNMSHRLTWQPDSSTLILQGPHIEISISRALPELRGGRARIEHQELSVRALIDTGASTTIINPQIASTCRLRQTGWVSISAVGALTGRFPVYAAAISFPRTNLPRWEVVPVVACPIISQPYFSCLIGRDVLRNWVVKYDGPNGKVEIRA